ncbi:hypothetical protein [Actinoplanes sp. ATCC 53533]|nr:hypothetical protein [Actinoplanes sp. ATCC 53533]
MFLAAFGALHRYARRRLIDLIAVRGPPARVGAPADITVVELAPLPA